LRKRAHFRRDDSEAASRASPARAASTPALRASRLVWKAISSTTPMIWQMLCEDFSMRVMASTASRTT
jgi:hypothetical protein